MNIYTDIPAKFDTCQQQFARSGTQILYNLLMNKLDIIMQKTFFYPDPIHV